MKTMMGAPSKEDFADAAFRQSVLCCDELTATARAWNARNLPRWKLHSARLTLLDCAIEWCRLGRDYDVVRSSCIATIAFRPLR